VALPYVLSAGDRDAFLSCRRAWDLSARERRNLEPRRAAARSNTNADAEPAGPAAEVVEGDLFRRVRLPRARAELASFGERLAAQVTAMVDPTFGRPPSSTT